LKKLLWLPPKAEEEKSRGKRRTRPVKQVRAAGWRGCVQRVEEIVARRDKRVSKKRQLQDSGQADRNRAKTLHKSLLLYASRRDTQNKKSIYFLRVIYFLRILVKKFEVIRACKRYNSFVPLKATGRKEKPPRRYGPMTQLPISLPSLPFPSIPFVVRFSSYPSRFLFLPLSNAQLVAPLLVCLNLLSGENAGPCCPVLTLFCSALWVGRACS